MQTMLAALGIGVDSHRSTRSSVHTTPPSFLALSRAYTCTRPNASFAPSTSCMPGGGPCPMIANHHDDCTARCDESPGCRAIAFQESISLGHPGSCYMYDHDLRITMPTSQPLRTALHVCTAAVGCPPPVANASLILVLVLKYETPSVRDWLYYHTMLGVRHFVLISNECEDIAHAALIAAAASTPCAPRLTFVHSFRCSGGFQIKAYTEAARVLLHEGVAESARVGFWDVDEYLVVRQQQAAVSQPTGLATGSLTDWLFQRGRADAEQWVLSVKPFGPALHDATPHGFIPANYLFGSDVAADFYGGYPKSVCSLGGLRTSWDRGQSLFCPDPKEPILCGHWPHHCLPLGKGTWTFPRGVARLNHYATKNEGEWRNKCARPNPTFRGLSRSSKAYCNDTAATESFFASLSAHVDLDLFSSLDASLGSASLPLDFLQRAQLAPAAAAALRRHCERLKAADPQVARGSAVGMLCRGTHASHAGGAGSVGTGTTGDSADAASELPSSDGCLYGCATGKKARAKPGSRAPLGEGMHSSQPTIAGKHRSDQCDCVALRLDFGEHRSRCKQIHDDRTYCWMRCCRPDQDASARRNSRTGPAHKTKG